MIYAFGGYALNTSAHRLAYGEEDIALEPQVFALLTLLVENHTRLVSKDEIIEKIWDGRFVSDAAVASRIKSARQAIGDDGKAQKLIRTIHGVGFRFVGDVKLIGSCENGVTAAQVSDEPIVPDTAEQQISENKRPSIAVLPLVMEGDAGDDSAMIARALPHDVITALSRLRWLFVTARASSFRFDGGVQDLRVVGKSLGVRYCLTGSLEALGPKIAVTVGLNDTLSSGVVWSDRFEASRDDIHSVREAIVSQIVVALELHIPLNEAQIARLKAPEAMDAWAAYHLGIQHMYRFNARDNARAAAYFTEALQKTPGFARAEAGLSFTHFQNAFLRYTDDIEGETRLARKHADNSLALDPLDPFGHFTMGRSFWLEGDLLGSLGWLDRATELSPNYAQGFYARAWANTIAGEGSVGNAHVEQALSLSPLDPLLYGMLGTRSLASLSAGNTKEAALWGEKAARAPGAHVLIALIAAVGHDADENSEAAKHWLMHMQNRRPDLTGADFFRAFPFRPGAARERIEAAFTRLGLAV